MDSAAVVRARRNRQQLIRREFVNGVNRVLVGPDNHTNLVLFEELVHDIGPVAHDIVLLLGVPRCVSLHAEHFVTFGRVTPHDVHAHLLHCVRNVSQVYA